MLTIINIKINGHNRQIAVDERASLADVLRHDLGLTSVKKGCEVGECGACTVLIDGEALNSCIYLAVWADGKEILTVEGLTAHDGSLHPVQQAFIDEAAIQCGFCTPGLIMSALAMFNKGRSYTRDELKTEISGHLCRCTGYQNILNALEKALNQQNS